MTRAPSTKIGRAARYYLEQRHLPDALSLPEFAAQYGVDSGSLRRAVRASRAAPAPSRSWSPPEWLDDRDAAREALVARGYSAREANALGMWAAMAATDGVLPDFAAPKARDMRAAAAQVAKLEDMLADLSPVLRSLDPAVDAARKALPALRRVLNRPISRRESIAAGLGRHGRWAMIMVLEAAKLGRRATAEDLHILSAFTEAKRPATRGAFRAERDAWETRHARALEAARAWLRDGQDLARERVASAHGTELDAIAREHSTISRALSVIEAD